MKKIPATVERYAIAQRSQNEQRQAMLQLASEMTSLDVRRNPD